MGVQPQIGFPPAILLHLGIAVTILENRRSMAVSPETLGAILGPDAQDAIAAHAGPLCDRPVIDFVVQAAPPDDHEVSVGKRLDVRQDVVGLQVVRRSENDPGGFEHPDVAFSPVPIGADVQEGDIGMAVIVLAQRLDERLELLEKDPIIPDLWDDLLAGGRGVVGDREWDWPSFGSRTDQAQRV